MFINIYRSAIVVMLSLALVLSLTSPAWGMDENVLYSYKRKLQQARNRGDRLNEGRLLAVIGDHYNLGGQKQKALKYYLMACPIHKEAGDKEALAFTFNNLGYAYRSIGRIQKSLFYLNKALTAFRDIGNQKNIPEVLLNMGLAYNTIGQKKTALEYFWKAMPLIRKTGNRPLLAEVYNNIGGVYSDLGNKKKALQYLLTSLSLAKQVGDQKKIAITLGDIGNLYSNMDRKKEALKYFLDALAILRTTRAPRQMARLLANLGVLYVDLNQQSMAMDAYEKALAIMKQGQDHHGESMVLNSVGKLYHVMDENKKALQYYHKSLVIKKKIGDLWGEAATLYNIGRLYSDMGQEEKRAEYHLRALPIMQTQGNRYGAAMVMRSIGASYMIKGKNQKAIQYLEKAVDMFRILDSPETEAVTLIYLVLAMSDLNQKQLAVYHGKRSVNIYQNLRSNISGFETRIKSDYLDANKDIYRYLTVVLMDGGRISEAQQLIDILKEKEYYEYIQNGRNQGSSAYTYMDLTKFEEGWNQQYIKRIKKLATLSNEHHILKFKPYKNNTEKTHMNQLQRALTRAQNGYMDFRTRMKQAFKQYQENRDAIKQDVAALEKKAIILKETLKLLDRTEGGKNVALHYLAYQGRVSIIMTTPTAQLVRQSSMDNRLLNIMIGEYRAIIGKLGRMARGVNIIDSNQDMQKQILLKKKIEKNLYDIMFKPVDQDLKNYGATNLSISLDGALRYIPLAALWDGKNYLIQRFRISSLTRSTLGNFKDSVATHLKILAMGASRGGDRYLPLPYVKREIRAIVKDEEKNFYGLIDGKGFLDFNFTRNTFIRQLKKNYYPLVHISSHFKFSPGDETKNHLLLGDGSIMSLSEIRSHKNLFDNVKLLVLSACETGVGGNGEEIDGFGELAQKCGAKSVIASLWPVADRSTKELMVAFYENIKDPNITSKIEALRLAQLKIAGLEDLLANPIQISPRKNTPYASSYYWGPFIMIGNWR